MIVIPMAGLSQRFRDAGYATPKYRLDLHGQSVFAHAVGSFRAYFDQEPFLFVVREDEGAPEFVASEARRLGVGEARVVALANPTKGQADTVRLGLDGAAVSASEPLTIFNIDTFRPGYLRPRQDWMATADGYLEVMPGSDPGFSYVLPDGADRKVAATAEKQVISSWASTGLYYFREASLFSGALERSVVHAASGELYIAPLYNDLIRAGRDVRYEPIGADEVVFCGTPSQYEHLLARPC